MLYASTVHINIFIANISSIAKLSIIANQLMSVLNYFMCGIKHIKLSSIPSQHSTAVTKLNY